MKIAVTHVDSQKDTKHKHTYKTCKESFLHVNNYKHVSNAQLSKYNKQLFYVPTSAILKIM